MKTINLQKVIAVKPVTNTLSVVILDIIHGIDDMVLACYDYHAGQAQRPKKLYTSASGRSYFNLYGQRFYLDEFMRVG